MKDSRGSEGETETDLFCFGIAILPVSPLVSQSQLFGLRCLGGKKMMSRMLVLPGNSLVLWMIQKPFQLLIWGGMDFISTFCVVGSQFWSDVTIYGIGHVYGAAWV